MFTLAAWCTLTVLGMGESQTRDDPQVLVDAIESLQQPLADFRCEFEGTLRARGKVAEAMKVGDDEVYEHYSGAFVWKSGGDIRIEGLYRKLSDNQIVSKVVVVREQQQEAEELIGASDGSAASGSKKKPKDVNTSRSSMGTIFLLPKLKREIGDRRRFRPSVSDEQLDGRQLRVLTIALAGVPNSTIFRYWIDLNRNGHVVREEDYASGQVMAYRLDIKLAPFKIDGREFWMPVSGESVGYNAVVDKKPVVMSAPQSFERIYVVNGTMDFNKHPRPEVFTIKYKPGTPISDNLRKLQYSFGQQQLAPKPTRSEVKKMLDDQVALAEKQQTELVVAPPSESSNWAPWLTSGFGALVLISLAALWVQRRR
jgi:hypothetical protein